MFLEQCVWANDFIIECSGANSFITQRFYRTIEKGYSQPAMYCSRRFKQTAVYNHVF
jgi:hypothetical protein